MPTYNKGDKEQEENLSETQRIMVSEEIPLDELNDQVAMLQDGMDIGMMPSLKKRVTSRTEVVSSCSQEYRILAKPYTRDDSSRGSYEYMSKKSNS